MLAKRSERAFCLIQAKRACCNASEARIFAPVGGIASDTEYKTVGKTEGKAEGMAGKDQNKAMQRVGQQKGNAEGRDNMRA